MEKKSIKNIRAIMPQPVQPDWDEEKLPMLELKYSFSQCTGDIQENSHMLWVDVEIMYGKGIGGYYGSVVKEDKKCIGRAMVKLLRWERADRLGDSGYVNGFGSQSGIESVLFTDDISENELKPHWAEEMKDCANKNILIIQWIELDEAYRGKGWGKLVMKQILHSFDDACGIVLAYPGDVQGIWLRDMPEYIPFFESVGFSRMNEEDYRPWSDIPIMYLNMYKPNEKLNEIITYAVCDY